MQNHNRTGGFKNYQKESFLPQLLLINLPETSSKKHANRKYNNPIEKFLSGFSLHKKTTPLTAGLFLCVNLYSSYGRATDQTPPMPSPFVSPGTVSPL